MSSTADAKDLGGPQDLPITCSIAGSKYLDVDVDGAFDAGDTKISDWPMTLYLDDGDGVLDADDTVVDDTTTDSNGDYVFTGLSDGVYHVVEGAARDGDTADDWQHQAARSTDGTVALDTNGDPTIIQGIAVDSSNTASTGNDFLNAQPPDVNVSKVAFDATYDTIDAGDDAEFTVTIGNDGPGTATDVSLSDDLPQLSTANAWAITAQTDDDCSIADDPPAAGAQQLTCTIASLASGATYSVTVSATTTGEDCGTITNDATVSAGNEPAGNVGDDNTDSATITVLCPDLTAAKSGTIAYTASVSNASGADVATADGVTLTDQLPGDLEWTVTAISAGGDVACGLVVGDVVTGGLIDCSGIELAPGASFEVSVQAAIDDAAGDCASTPLIDNQVSGSATNEASADTADNSASAAVCPVPAP